jgi:hypothetical protein
MTFTCIEKLADLDKIVKTTIARAIQGDELARKINKEVSVMHLSQSGYNR